MNGSRRRAGPGPSAYRRTGSAGAGTPGQGAAGPGHQPRQTRREPYWPKELAELPGAIPHERYVTLLPLALSKAQDDKGRVRWMFYGGSEQGPDRAFWKSFYYAPGQERRPEYAVDFIRRLLHSAYGEKLERLTDLRRSRFPHPAGFGRDGVQTVAAGSPAELDAAFSFGRAGIAEGC